MPQDFTKASLAETLQVLTRVIGPTFAKGVIIRRPSMEHSAARFGLDSRAIATLQRLRDAHGGRAVLLNLPVRPHLVLLDPADVDHVLQRSPDPFATATREKRAALNHLEPGNVLISGAPRRAQLRPLHEAALATAERVHPLAARCTALVEAEFGAVAGHMPGSEWGWEDFSTAWFRIVRRLVLGDAARNDEAFTALLDRVRGRANWAYFLRQNRALREELLRRIGTYQANADPGSLAARMPRDEAIEPASQITQWLFAFDPAGMATFRTLALLALHPHIASQARAEAAAGHGDRPFTRRCFLESLRLWPTTPAILREATTDVAWGGTRLEKGTGILIFTPFFHRDRARFTDADRMNPDIWLSGDSLPLQGLVPFSAGPGLCPAHNLVPLLASLAIGFFLSRSQLSLVGPRMDPERLPGTLDHRAIRLAQTQTSA
ncbi:cytochrome P450 [Rhizobium sp. SAFR-030]|uniref:cytochrome P450 n=1 Tax=Rhizobium sp. SAFR-030 TaxID=3387277 RepID=UPI003F7E8495